MKKAKSASRRFVQHRRFLRAFIVRHIRGARDYHDGPPAETAGCNHDWVLEGQTLVGNVYSCAKCKRLWFS